MIPKRVWMPVFVAEVFTATVCAFTALQPHPIGAPLRLIATFLAVICTGLAYDVWRTSR